MKSITYGVFQEESAKIQDDINHVILNKKKLY
jgi:hypothetical protein